MNLDFETLRDEMEQAIGGLDACQTQLRPGGNETRWSIQQTVGHLLMTYAATAKVVDARIAKATATKARPTLIQRLGQVTVIRAGIFPRGRTAPEMVTPPADEPPVPSAVLIERVALALKSLDFRMMAAEKVFGVKQRAISHIVVGRRA